jgi:hypothetical protein
MPACCKGRPTHSQMLLLCAAAAAVRNAGSSGNQLQMSAEAGSEGIGKAITTGLEIMGVPPALRGGTCRANGNAGQKGGGKDAMPV